MGCIVGKQQRPSSSTGDAPRAADKLSPVVPGGSPTSSVSSSPVWGVPTHEANESFAGFSSGYGGARARPSAAVYKPVLSKDGMVQVSALPARDAVLCGVRNELHVLLQVQTMPMVTPKRAPFELSLVLDSSGSMSGDSIETAKLTMIKMLSHLKEGDTIHVINYSDEATLVASGSYRDVDSLTERIRSIHANGSTNIASGLNLAYDTMAKNAQKRKSEGASGVIFLFSDGCDNSGSAAKGILGKLVEKRSSEEDVSVHSLGIGTHYDESTMRAIAEEGLGAYIRIEDVEEIGAQVAVAFEGILTLVGSSPVVQVRGRNGCIVKKAWGHAQEELLKGLGLPSMRADNLQEVLLSVDVDPMCEPDTKIPILDYTLTWTDRLVGIPTQRELRGEVCVQATTDPAALDAELGDVVVSLRLTECGAASEAVAESLQRGQHQRAIDLQAEAVGILEAIIPLDKSKRERARNMHRAMQSDLEEFQSRPKERWDMERMTKNAQFRGYAAGCADEWMYQLM
eukprot:Hpha_TRINITY_DN15902_c0_g6::TRINITY_DN15902_c0_g6_i2::g.71153::m.71153/K07114/yfbK; Ca-activated chloride channel homolog